MKNKKPFILISNDDGYHSGGIKYLAEMLQDDADLLIVAPESARSGYSCAFSATNPLRLKRRNRIPNVEIWSCNGTPVDCVKLALDQFCQDRIPDLIIGGINLDPIITHRFHIDEFQKGFDIMEEGNCGKVILDWE